jgi:hypothetical protein
MSRAILAITILSSMVTTSCFKMGTSQLGNTVLRSGQGAATQLKTETNATGATTANVDANSASTQLVTASNNSSVKGSSVSFPPGSLAISTSITLEEGASVATPAFAAELNLGTDLTKSGTAVTLNAGTATDAKLPFKLSIPLPVSLALAEDWANLVVLYKVTVVAGATNVIGVIPRSEIEIVDGTAQISTQYFGSFQAAITKDVVTEKKEIATKSMILTKQESQSLAPVGVSSRMPFIVKSKGSIEINGINFRQTMVVAMGGSKVSGLKVLSDSKATFIAPELSGYGLTTVSVEQDGVAQAVSVFYAGDKADLPVSTKPESEICAGEKYYDANGIVRTGTRVCNGITNPTAPITDNLVAANIRAGVTINGVLGSFAPPCSVDGETGCVTVTGYPAMNAAIAGPKILAGQTLATVSGLAPVRPADCAAENAVNCVAVSNFPAVNKSIIQNNAYKIHPAVNIAGVQGTLATCNTDNQTGCYTVSTYPAVDKASFTEWDLRNGKTIAGKVGKLVFSKGHASFTFYDRLSGSGSNPGADFYDTVIDGAALPPNEIAGLTNASDNFATNPISDANGNGACDNGEECVLVDKITGLNWTKKSPNQVSWDDAINYCYTLNKAGIAGGNWRLPTQKELMQAHIDGLYSKYMELELTLPVWTATTSADTLKAVNFTFSDGSTGLGIKTSGLFHSICVH